MQRTDSEPRTMFARWLREPTLHFFLAGAALFLAHRLVMGDPRTIVITPALKADVLRRFEDQLGGRRLSEKEAESLMENWKVEEALYREALREGLDREDARVRGVLIAKMRERATLQTRVPEPTEAQLQQYFAEHRDDYESPMIYEHEFIVFPKSEADAEQKRAEAERQLKKGATIASLGLRSTAANVDRARIEQEFGAEVADQITKLPLGEWRELETSDRLILVKMIGTHGGLPPPDVLHARLVAGWQTDVADKALARATKEIAARYRFEEPSQ